MGHLLSQLLRELSFRVEVDATEHCIVFRESLEQHFKGLVSEIGTALNREVR